MKRYQLNLVLMVFLFAGILTAQSNEKRVRARDLGVDVGVLPTGNYNSITDVAGVKVGHKTRKEGDSIRTGVTVIIPHEGNIYQQKVPAAIYCFNSFGKLAGSTQVEELGNIETPIVLTNTLNVGTGVLGVVKYTLQQPGNEYVRSVNAVVGETNDGYLNDIRGTHVTEQDILDAIKNAKEGPVLEGAAGAGMGTVAFGYKGGIGTSSRQIIYKNKTYTVGVLVQSNFGKDLIINGVPFSREIKQQEAKDKGKEDGSCMIVIATDAPLSERNLKRMAKRSFIGMGRTTSVMTNGSGDFVIAFSTAYTIPNETNKHTYSVPELIGNDYMSDLFRAVEEAAQEAIYNSLFMAETVTGYKGRTIEALPLDKVIEVMKKYNMLNLSNKLNKSLWYQPDK